MPIDLSDSEVQSSAAALQQRQQFTAQKNAPDLGLTDEDLANSAKSIGAVPGGDANPYAKLSMAGAAGKWLLDGFSNDIGSLMAFGNQAGKAMTEAVGGIAQTVAPGQSDAIARDEGKLTENSPANQAIVDNHQTAGATGGFVGDLALFLVTNNLKADDLLDPTRKLNLPKSVVEMLQGGLGQPEGGWPKALQKVVLARWLDGSGAN